MRLSQSLISFNGGSNMNTLHAILTEPGLWISLGMMALAFGLAWRWWGKPRIDISGRRGYRE